MKMQILNPTGFMSCTSSSSHDRTIHSGSVGNHLTIRRTSLLRAIRHVFISSLFCLPLIVHSADWYVALTSTTDGPGTDWSTAFHDIQSAVDAASTGDRVWVSNGVYNTGVTLVDGMPCRIVVTNAVHVESVSGSSVTVIHGEGPIGASAVRGAFLSNGASLTGFTISNGHSRASGDYTTEQSGGGVLMENATLSNCVVKDNHAQYGGGVNLVSNAVVHDCRFIGNAAGVDGGAVYIDFGAVVNGCDFELNMANDDGGAVFCDMGGEFAWCSFLSNSAFFGGAVNSYYAGTFTDCTFSNNSALLDGGAVYIDYGGRFVRCDIMGNHSGANGGGVFLHNEGHFIHSAFLNNDAGFSGGGAYIYEEGILEQCVFISNSAAYAGGVNLNKGGEVNNSLICSNYAVTNGGGVYMDESGTFLHCTIRDNLAGIDFGGVYGAPDTTMINSIVWDNAPTNYNVNSGTWINSCTLPPKGENGISAEPQFVSWNHAALQEASLCIDAAASHVSDSEDINGTDRPLDGNADALSIPDIGAFEFSSSIADSDGDGVSDWGEYVCDTGGADSKDWFRIISYADDAVSFYSSGDRIYTLLFRSSLTTGSWQQVSGQVNLPGSGMMMSLPATNAYSECFFSVSVSLP